MKGARALDQEDKERGSRLGAFLALQETLQPCCDNEAGEAELEEIWVTSDAVVKEPHVRQPHPGTWHARR